MAGTDETQTDGTAPAGSPDPSNPPDTSAAVAATLERLRAAEGVEPNEAKTFVDKLAEDGIETTVTPKPEAPEAPADDAGAAADTAPDTATDEAAGLDDLVDAISTTRGAKVNAAQERQAQFEAKGIPTSLAKAMAHHGSRKDAEEFLASYGNPVQSETAGQPAPVEAKAPAGVAPLPALAEVQSKLEELGGEETASAVAGYLSQITERLAAVEGAAQMSVQTLETQRKSELRETAQRVTGELSRQFSGLVRDGVTDPAVMQTAAALYERGHTEGDLEASIRAACFSVYGSQAAPERQTPIETAPSPDLSAPDDVRALGTGPIGREEEQNILSEVMVRYRNDPERRSVALKRAQTMITRRNTANRK